MIGEDVKNHAHTQPHKIAIQCEDNQITYHQLQNEIHSLQNRLSYLFTDLKGKRIAFLMKNSIEWMEMFLAISSSGAIAIPIDQKWGQNQIDALLGDCSPDLLVYDASLLKPILCSKRTNIYTLEQFHAIPQQDRCFIQKLKREDLFYIGYTSGTTGSPKGFMRTHSSWASCFSCGKEVFSLSKDSKVLSPGPFVHSHFLYASVQALHIGCTLHILPSFESSNVWELIEKENISVLYVVPTMLEALKRSYMENDTLSVEKIISSGARWSQEAKRSTQKLFPTTVLYEFFGASELSFIAFKKIDAQQEDRSIGLPFPEVEISVRSENGNETEINEIGSLYVKSPWTFSGYLNRPEETSNVFNNGWATVGDLARKGEDGQIYLVGRKQNMIISGGLNIYPEEVEIILNQHPSIKEAIVIGIEDSYWGEQVVAIYVEKEEKSNTMEPYQNYCRQHLPRYKCPKQFINVNNFPYTSSGKIARHTLKQMIETNQII